MIRNPIARAVEAALGAAPEAREAVERAYLAAVTTGTGVLRYDAAPEAQGRAVRVRFKSSAAEDVFDLTMLLEDALRKRLAH